MSSVPTVHLSDLGLMVRLGRRRPKVMPQVARFKSYLLKDVPTPPELIDYSAKALPALRRVYLNDQLGCCVIAGAMHQIGLWSGNDGASAIQFTDDDVVKYYGIIGGYRPGHPSTDRGCSIVDCLNYLGKTGFNGQKIAGYVAADNADAVEVKIASLLFGSLKLGINLPNEWLRTAREGFVWGPAQPNPRQGHDVITVGYDHIGVRICTWGLLGTITWEAFADTSIIEECYAAVGLSWTGADQKSPPGVSLKQLLADLSILGGGGLPPLPTPEPPDPPTPPVPPIPPTPGRTIIGIACDNVNLSINGQTILIPKGP